MTTTTDDDGRRDTVVLELPLVEDTVVLELSLVVLTMVELPVLEDTVVLEVSLLVLTVVELVGDTVVLSSEYTFQFQPVPVIGESHVSTHQHDPPSSPAY